MIVHGCYSDVPAEDPLYRGALGQLAAVTLGVSARRAKFKLGQNRPVETRRRIITELRKRGRPPDGRAADALEWTLTADDRATRAAAPGA